MAQNEVMIPNEVPAYLKALLAGNPALTKINEDAANGIGGGSVPTIVANQGIFKTKVDGVEEVIQIEVPGMGKINAPKISAVVLKGKPVLDRAYYATNFTPGQEPQSPDCSSEDGVKPKADSPNKQCESCAGCPQNVFGSGKKADGSPSKGKACAERKRIAIFANNGIYKFSIPPASLGDFSAYVKQLSAHGLALPTVITSISFDAVDTHKLVFAFQGMLNEAQAAKLIPMIDSPEVSAIMDNFGAAQLPAPATPAAQGPSEAEKKAAEKKAADEKKAAAKKAKEEKEAAEKAAAEAAAASGIGAGSDDLGLGLDDSSGPATLSDDDLGALFGI